MTAANAPSPGGAVRGISFSRDPAKPEVLHVVCDRDVGLFNLVLGVIPHTYWAHREGRIPIVYYGPKTAYWTPKGYRGADTVWEYYFEPVLPEYPASRIPPRIVEWLDRNPLDRTSHGRFIDGSTFVSNHGAWHIGIDGEAAPGGEGLRGPGRGKPTRRVRLLASAIVRDFIRPRAYIRTRADEFHRAHLAGRYVVGVHIRGTDALVDPTRYVQMTRVDFARYVAVIRNLIRRRRDAVVLVASDSQDSVERIRAEFRNAIAFDSIRHVGGELAGQGPAGGILPAYLTQDRDRAAQNGEEAVIEYLLLRRSNVLVHNHSSIPQMVVLSEPDLPDINVDEAVVKAGLMEGVKRRFEELRRRGKTLFEGRSRAGEP
jgi:hypothetical protein